MKDDPTAGAYRHIPLLVNAVRSIIYLIKDGKGKGHPCIGTEALYRSYGPYGE